MKNKKWLWIVLGVIVVAALVVGNIVRGQAGKVRAVQFAKVRVEDVTSTVRAPGKIEPKTQVKVSADIPGKIVHLLVKEGDPVKQGQLMLQIDDTQYRATYDQSKSELEAAKARLREAEASYKVVDANFGRQKALYDQKLLSQAEWDQAVQKHESGRVAVTTAQEAVTQWTAGVDAARDNLSKCRFVAPFDGVVSALNVEQGEIVVLGTMNNPGTQILVVSDLSAMIVRADVDETDIVDMRLGQKGKITVDALPDTSFPGTVIEIGNTAKRTATSSVEGQTNFEVKVAFDHQVEAVRPGMTADVEIETATHPKATAVPIQAVVVRTQRELDRAARKDRKASKGDVAEAAEEDTVGRKDKEITGVFVDRDGKAEFVPVRTGIASETMIEVFGDLKEGERIVSGPYKALRELKPGTRVKQEKATGRAKET